MNSMRNIKLQQATDPTAAITDTVASCLRTYSSDLYSCFSVQGQV